MADTTDYKALYEQEERLRKIAEGRADDAIRAYDNLARLVRPLLDNVEKMKEPLDRIQQIMTLVGTDEPANQLLRRCLEVLKG